jgi:hypothetical protein
VRPRLIVVALLLFPTFRAPIPASAQDNAAPLPPPLTLTHVEGRVDLARGTGVEPAQVPDLVEDGHRLVTGDGRAELAYADGSLLHVDRDTDAHVDRDGRFRVVRGRIIVRTPADAAVVEIGTPVGVLHLAPRGEYEIRARDLDGPSDLATRAGQATLVQTDRDLPIGPDDELSLEPRGGEPRWARIGSRRDAFTDWSAARVAAMHTAQASQPLPPELSAYATDFAIYGSWDTLPTYGAVWYPHVAAGWRPYAHGAWRYTRYGWTWIDRQRWGWPVHHYGRWGQHPQRGWYWMPRPGWGPAWVGWASQGGYLGWAALGWNASPLPGVAVGGYGGAIGPGSGWSVVPRAAFGGRGPIGPAFIDGRALPGPVAGGWLSGPVAGGWVHHAAPPPRPAWTQPGMSGRPVAPRPPGSVTPLPRGPRRPVADASPAGAAAAASAAIAAPASPGLVDRTPGRIAAPDTRTWRHPVPPQTRLPESAPAAVTSRAVAPRRVADARRPGDAPPPGAPGGTPNAGGTTARESAPTTAGVPRAYGRPPSTAGGRPSVPPATGGASQGGGRAPAAGRPGGGGANGTTRAPVAQGATRSAAPGGSAAGAARGSGGAAPSRGGAARGGGRGR